MTNPRLAAIDAGLSVYEGRAPCKYGHPNRRYSSNGQCIECVRLRQQNYHARLNRGRAARASDGALISVTYTIRASQKAIADEMMAALNLLPDSTVQTYTVDGVVFEVQNPSSAAQSHGIGP